MKAAIIAAGRGERLLRGGVSTPKPLIPVAGEPLIARVIRAAAASGVSSVACIVNDINPEPANYLRSGSWQVPLELVVRTTPSSMESLFSLAPLLRDEPFLLFTVDAVFDADLLRGFISRAVAFDGADGVLALTNFVDDEKPLWVELDQDHKILALGERARAARCITAGFYYFSPAIFAMMESARGNKLKALRQFLALLVERGYRLYGVPVAKTVDVDYPEDIDKAERYLQELKSGEPA